MFENISCFRLKYFVRSSKRDSWHDFFARYEHFAICTFLLEEKVPEPTIEDEAESILSIAKVEDSGETEIELVIIKNEAVETEKSETETSKIENLEIDNSDIDN